VRECSAWGRGAISPRGTWSRAIACSPFQGHHVALPVLTELITRFQDDENTNIQMIVSDAREAREEIINKEG
jgi:hypothetical protein